LVFSTPSLKAGALASTYDATGRSRRFPRPFKLQQLGCQPALSTHRMAFWPQSGDGAPHSCAVQVSQGAVVGRLPTLKYLVGPPAAIRVAPQLNRSDGVVPSRSDSSEVEPPRLIQPMCRSPCLPPTLSAGGGVGARASTPRSVDSESQLAVWTIHSGPPTTGKLGIVPSPIESGKLRPLSEALCPSMASRAMTNRRRHWN